MEEREVSLEMLHAAVASIRKRTDCVPKIALVLGSGLGAFAERIDREAVIPYSEIEGFPVSSVSGHAGRFVFGKVEGTPVVVMQGRVHYYEGYSMQEVTMPARVMRMLGAEVLFLTNVSGGINTDFHVGDFMLIRDHISTFVPSPLRGTNIDALGPRFPDMSGIYETACCDAIRAAAEGLQIGLREGVYVQTPGPNYETPAEIRMLRALGADAVGMSTTCEAMVGRHMGMRVCGISCISNMAAGIEKKQLSHAEVQETADRVAADFQSLVYDSIVRIAANTGFAKTV